MLSRCYDVLKTVLNQFNRPWVSLVVAGAMLAGIVAFLAISGAGLPTQPTLNAAQAKEKIPASDFVGGTAWLNTDKPIKLADLKGRIVLLDFWTLCCINCIHTLPDLAKLEARYPGVLVVIGVHSPKFDNEKKTASIFKAILRYEIKHPVVNDADHRIWKAYGVNSWPTLVLIDPDGNYYGTASGEGNLEVLDFHIRKIMKDFKGKLKEDPIPFKLAKEKFDNSIYFPGKVLADADSNRLFIADSTNHRIVITNLEGKKLAIAGSGKEGLKDGTFAQAQFSDPQGMCLDGDTLYVADRKNHAIRALNLKKETVTLVAGTGEQNRFGRQPKETDALKTGLNSPWDLLLHDKMIYVAMAGHHQIWQFDPAAKTVVAYAGNGSEQLIDGTLRGSAFAQPSGLATDGKRLFVADSEISAIRSVPLPGTKENVSTIVGDGLFEFGDINGKGKDVRLQHALGVARHDGMLYVADTYNSKIKLIDPESDKIAKIEKQMSIIEIKLDDLPADAPAAKKLAAEYRMLQKERFSLGICSIFLGDGPGWLKEKMLDEPGGISIAAGKMYIADTNNHRIQVVDMKTKVMTTLRLQDVPPVPRGEVKAGAK
ncbi:MAG: redoxin domain-containing protein [Planctomycetes bacterium]|nr:redoxin domain-containing protein [Planctomycetota bacterium]